MSMRLERYYRVNMMPYFISERTPSEKREDLWELLEEVGLDYYDPVSYTHLDVYKRQELRSELNLLSEAYSPDLLQRAERVLLEPKRKHSWHF